MAVTFRENLRTKIVATIGPATAAPGMLESLLETGTDVCRLNFSHGERSWHEAALKRIRAWSAEHNRPVAVLGDLCGPKIRLNTVCGGQATINPGDQVRFARGEDECVSNRLTVTYRRFVDEVEVGHRVYIDDGLIRMLVIDRSDDELVCTCTVGGPLSTRKGVNLPDTRLSVPALTEKDHEDALWAVQNGFDFIALSFARRPSDLKQLRKLVDGHGDHTAIIVKIEKVEALEHIGELVEQSDGVMVARGDLGVEMDVWQVPLLQKGLTRRCRDAGKPVIIATQMLQSMISAPMPTRAEVSDVANAILDGVDAVMLSAETATGRYPSAAVEVMRRVAEVTEAYRTEATRGDVTVLSPIGDGCVSAIAEAAAKAAVHLGARAIAAWTTSGETVRMVARYRLPIPVIGLTNDERVYRRMNLLHGVVPMLADPPAGHGDLNTLMNEKLKAAGFVSRGDVIVLVDSTQPTVRGTTDTLRIHRVS
ncbi:MAG: pyruvate kinase [Planctomycetes bacterium]|nr:pyruvate kinase [Planctomycetota bacterium]